MVTSLRIDARLHRTEIRFIRKTDGYQYIHRWLGALPVATHPNCHTKRRTKVFASAVRGTCTAMLLNSYLEQFEPQADMLLTTAYFQSAFKRFYLKKRILDPIAPTRSWRILYPFIIVYVQITCRTSAALEISCDVLSLSVS